MAASATADRVWRETVAANDIRAPERFPSGGEADPAPMGLVMQVVSEHGLAKWRQPPVSAAEDSELRRWWNGGASRSRPAALPDAASAAAVAAPVVIELQVRLGLERDEEAEGEVPVRRLVEGEGRPPVGHVALQRDDVARELGGLDVVDRRPRHGPQRGELERHGAVHRLGVRSTIDRSASIDAAGVSDGGRIAKVLDAPVEERRPDEEPGLLAL